MAAALSLLVVLLMAPPFLSAGVMPSPRMGKIVFTTVRSIIKKTGKDYLEDKAKEGVRGFAAGTTNDGHKLGRSAADSYGALTFNLAVGEGISPQSLPVVMDITSELIWAQCDDPCTSCVRQTTPETPTFRSDRSSSFVRIRCDDQTCQSFIPGYTCDNEAGDTCAYTENFFFSGKTSGYLAKETFSFETTPFPGMAFGCGGETLLPELAVAGASGFAGFSRGALSLVSQLNISRFSYLIALPDDSGNSKSFLKWTTGMGDDAADLPAKGSRSTPLLVPTGKQNPYWYYVNLTGIEVDGEHLTAIPAGTFDVGADGSGGVFLSTTLPVTYLEVDAYTVLRKELVSRIESQGVAPANADDDLNHLCFRTEEYDKVKVPKLALVFDGSDAAMELSPENYFFMLDNGKTCLTILPSTGGSVLGSLLQVDTAMTYDIYANGSGLLTFETAAATLASTGAPAQAQELIMAIVCSHSSSSLGAQPLKSRVCYLYSSGLLFSFQLFCGTLNK